MNRADNILKLAREGIRNNNTDNAKLQKIVDMYTAPSTTDGRSGRVMSKGWKVGVSRDIVKFFHSLPPETWLTLEDVQRALPDWAPDTVHSSLNKQVTRYKTLIRQGDRGGYRYARVATTLDVQRKFAQESP